MLFYRQWTSLHWASGSGRCDIAEALLQHRADIHAKDDSRWEPLHWAASGGHIELVNMLLMSQADVNARCKRSAYVALNYHYHTIHALKRSLHTPMHWATTMGHVNVASVLQQHGGTLIDDISVLNTRLQPRLKEHESSNLSGIGWTKFQHCPTGMVRLSFLLPDYSHCAISIEESRPDFQMSTNDGRSWKSLACMNCVCSCLNEERRYELDAMHTGPRKLGGQTVS